MDVEVLKEAGVTHVLIGWRNVRTRQFDRLAAVLDGMTVLLDPGYGTGGRPEEYLAFARGYDDLWDGCLSWDVPGGAVDENLHWFLWCRSAGLPKTIPVFHPGMPWRFLAVMAAQCGRVALGGLLRMPLPQRRAYLDELFFRPDGSPRAPGLQVHGCGMDHPEILTRYPWASVDAMTWLNPRRFGKGGTLREAIARQAAKARIEYRPILRPRFLWDYAHELAYGAQTITSEVWAMAVMDAYVNRRGGRRHAFRDCPGL